MRNMTAKQDQYLAELAEKNREEKRRNELSDKERELKEKEQGFRLTFAGANTKKEAGKNKQRPLSIKKKSANSSNQKKRRTWGETLSPPSEKRIHKSSEVGEASRIRILTESPKNRDIFRSYSPASPKLHHNHQLQKLVEKIYKLNPSHIQALDDIVNEMIQEEEHAQTKKYNLIVIEMKSNWGFESYIGLTGIQLFDFDDNEVELSIDQFDVDFEVDELLNKNLKTNKSEYMWKTEFTGEPIKLNILVEQDISHIQLWNYNCKASLSMGLKKSAIYYNSECVWEGQVPKGCGKKLDYSFFVDLHPEDDKSDSESDAESSSSLRTPESPLGETLKHPIEVPVLKDVDANFSDNEDTMDTMASLSDTEKVSTGLQDSWAIKSTMKLPTSEEDNDINVEDAQVTKLPWESPKPISKEKIAKAFEQNPLLAAAKREKPEKVDLWLSHAKNTFSESIEFNEEESKILNRKQRTIHRQPKQERRVKIKSSGKEKIQPPKNLDMRRLSSEKKSSNAKVKKRFDDSLSVFPVIEANDVLSQSIDSLNHFNLNSKSRLFASNTEFEESPEKKPVNKWNKKQTIIPELHQEAFIPNLPSGKKLVMNILSTHGDQHYVGLRGIDIFDEDGEIIRPVEVSADPPDINCLPEYSNDPRVVTNLFKGDFLTRDDMQTWLTPFSESQDHLITMKFDSRKTIGAIRVWNYNKSRVHATRGVKMIQLRFDKSLIFEGEISKSNVDNQPHLEGEILLFTTNAIAIAAMSSYYERLHQSHQQPTNPQTSSQERPKTGDKTSKELLNSRDVSLPKSTCKDIRLEILSSWGSSDYVGMASLAIFCANTKIQPAVLTANPKDLSTVLENNDKRVLNNLFNDDTSLTWLAPISDPNVVSMSFQEQQAISTIKITNLNSDRSAKHLKLYLDGEFKGEFVLAQDGTTTIPLVQTCPSAVRSPSIRQSILAHRGMTLPQRDYIAPVFPIGSVFRIALISSYGDRHYIGLNGIELFDASHSKITLHPYQVKTTSIADFQQDSRVASNLVSFPMSTQDPSSMWLTLKEPSTCIDIVFDEPIAVSAMVFYNYAKTKSRGTYEIACYADGLLFYQGYLRPFSPSGQIIFFSPNKSFLSSNAHRRFLLRDAPQNVVFWNETRMLQHQKSTLHYVPQAFQHAEDRPTTSAASKS